MTSPSPRLKMLDPRQRVADAKVEVGDERQEALPNVRCGPAPQPPDLFPVRRPKCPESVRAEMCGGEFHP